MELMLERLEGSAWHTVDPYVAPAQGDRVRFHFPNQLRRLQVMNAGKEYSVPTTSITLRVAGHPRIRGGLPDGDPAPPRLHRRLRVLLIGCPPRVLRRTGGTEERKCPPSWTDPTGEQIAEIFHRLWILIPDIIAFQSVFEAGD